MKEEDVSNFEKIQVQLESLHAEISSLAKKSQNDSLNTFKLKFVNKTLTVANSLLGNDYRPFDDFEKFGDDDVPTNSDVTMILGQYLGCLEKFRADNIDKDKYGVWFWKIESEEKIRTSAPKKISEKK